MRKFFAVLLLLVLGCFKVGFGQAVTPTPVGTPIAVTSQLTAVTMQATLVPFHKVKDPAEFATKWKEIKVQQSYYERAKAEGDYISAAKLTPFDWVAAWCWYNVAWQAYKEDNRKVCAKALKTAAGYESKAVGCAYGFRGGKTKDGKDCSQKAFDKHCQDLHDWLEGKGVFASKTPVAGGPTDAEGNSTMAKAPPDDDDKGAGN